MEWNDLHDLIPYAKTSQGYRPHQFYEIPYFGRDWEIRVTFPGDHEFDTDPKGGDYAIAVTAPIAGRDQAGGWGTHLFTHRDLWSDVESKVEADKVYMRNVFAPALVSVVAEGAEPGSPASPGELPGLDVEVLLKASQVLAVCEWRRFWWSQEPTGGRCLSTHFALGIIFARWDAQMAKRVWKQGIGGLTTLKVLRGVDPVTFREALGGHDPADPPAPWGVRPVTSRAVVDPTHET